AVRLHAVVGRVGRRAVAGDRAPSRGDLLPDRDQRRRRGERLLARADDAVQGASGGERGVSQDARLGGDDAGAAEGEAAEELVAAVGAVLPEAWQRRGDVVERGAGSDRNGRGASLAATGNAHSNQGAACEG